MSRITVQVATRDRHSEVALLLQSLRTQTFVAWDLMLLDDGSGTPLDSCHFVQSLLNRIRLEGHGVKVLRSDRSDGVCAARNKLIEMDDFDNELVARLDDDVILERDYLNDLFCVLQNGCDLASGVVPLLASPELFRPKTFEIINQHCFDKSGELVRQDDDCGFRYSEENVYPTHQFRTNALYKKAITDAGVRYPSNLTKVGFREEGHFSFQALLKGFKLCVDVGAIAYHLQTPSGGCRSDTYGADVALDDVTFKRWCKKMFKEKGDFLSEEKKC